MTDARRAPVAVVLAAAALFLVVNRAAWHGWFQHDDFAHLSWTTQVPARDFLTGLLSPVYPRSNVRPVGHAWYALLGRTAGLDFPWYLASMHLFHLAAAALLWLLLARLGTKPWAAAAAVVFFLYHAALFDIYWHPAYVFDLLCAVFSLASLLSYAGGRPLLSFAFFWLAYKSKEPAVMLPAVLACYEWWLGQRRWKRLVPFLAVSLSFGLQGLLLNPSQGHDYAFRFGLPALWRTLRYYTDQFATVPWAGLAVLAALPLAVRDRRVYFGEAAFFLMLVPMLLLPERARGVYLYESMIGAAVALGAAAERLRPAWAAAFLVLWLPWNYTRLPAYRRAALTEAVQNRAYVIPLVEDARRFPATGRFLFETAPPGLPPWAIEGALRYVYRRHDPQLRYLKDFPSRRAAWDWPGAALLNWDPGSTKLYVLRRDGGPRPFLTMRGDAPPWPLEEGWYSLAAGCRWTRGRATATFWRPPRARTFELQVLVGPDQLRRRGGAAAAVLLDGRPLPPAWFSAEGRHAARWDLAPAPAGPVRVELRVPPENQLAGNDGELGIAVIGLGFLPGP